MIIAITDFYTSADFIPKYYENQIHNWHNLHESKSDIKKFKNGLKFALRNRPNTRSETKKNQNLSLI